MKKLLIILTSILLLTCCSTSHEEKAMQQVESMIYSSPDSAKKMLQQIPVTKLESESDKAFYALLKSVITYRLYEKQSLKNINYALAYYKEHKDKHHLQMAYFYHGAINLENNGSIIRSMRDYKESEVLIKHTGNKILESYIYNGLIKIFFLHNANVLGLDYSNKSINLAKEMNDNETLSGAFGNKAIFYERCGKKDSALTYYKQSLKYVDYVKYNYDKATIYDNVAFYFDVQSNTAKAKKYHELATQCVPNDSNYSIWNQLYKCDNFNEAIQKSREIHPSDLFEEYNLYVVLSQVARKNGINQMAFKYGDKADSIQDLIDKDKYQYEIKKIQEEYIRKGLDKNAHSNRILFLLIITAIFIVSIIMICSIRRYNTKKVSRLRQKIEYLQGEINRFADSLSYKDTNEGMSSSNVQEKEVLVALREELNSLKKQSKKELTIYKKRHNQFINGLEITLKVLQNSPIKILEKGDRHDFIYLHSEKDPMLKSIMPLTSTQDQVLFILVGLGCSREQIQQALCLSNDSFRKEKSRLLYKLRDLPNLQFFCDNLKDL